MSNPKTTCPTCKRPNVGTTKPPVYPPHGREQILKVMWHRHEGKRCDGTGERVTA